MRPLQDLRILQVHHRELQLQSFDVRCLQRMLQLLQIKIGDADVLDHALFLEPVQGSEGLLIRHLRVRPMDDHQVYIVGAQIFERFFTLSQDQVSLARTHILPVNKGIGALCGDLHFFALPRPEVIESHSDVALSLSRVVGGCCIYKIDPALNRRRDRVQPRLV